MGPHEQGEVADKSKKPTPHPMTLDSHKSDHLSQLLGMYGMDGACDGEAVNFLPVAFACFGSRMSQNVGLKMGQKCIFPKCPGTLWDGKRGILGLVVSTG